MRILRTILLSSLIFANSAGYCSSREETKEKIVDVVSKIVVRECKETKAKLRLDDYNIENDLKNIKKNIKSSYHPSCLIQDFINLLTLGCLLAPDSYKEFSVLRRDVSKMQNRILRYACKIYESDEINEDVFLYCLKKEVSHEDLIKVYNKGFDLGIEAAINDVKNNKTGAKDKLKFLISSYANGYIYIEEGYNCKKELNFKK